MAPLRIIADRHQVAGKVALLRNGKPVWIGDIMAPWDDVDCDTIIVAPSDYDKIERAFNERALPPRGLPRG